ncbi:probable glycosyltransferase At5g03795 [Rosa chinensis]|uniref:probable glycosyltransferase At5g03795 n=1 Tax=Rosa chinensis TaxID=74649 RepID=UPI001AD8AD95|nr:probable glycosyltransferase At5g03795 [Rosa chinensis]
MALFLIESLLNSFFYIYSILVEYGRTSHIFNCYTFDENTPLVDDPEYIFAFGETKFKGLQSGDKYAKKEIDHAPEVIDDPDLYAPLFRNMSVFKRSYELMELILKVYIYSDGSRPIFHVPHLNGIYASEGWFMRLMEGNRQFVTRDPKKAHLFYLPYSMRQLELKLYVPGSHQIKPLAIFLRDYVNMIAGKYPFWNCTHGTDHFLVACHDWGPHAYSARGTGQQYNKSSMQR